MFYSAYSAVQRYSTIQCHSACTNSLNIGARAITPVNMTECNMILASAVCKCPGAVSVLRNTGSGRGGVWFRSPCRVGPVRVRGAPMVRGQEERGRGGDAENR